MSQGIKTHQTQNINSETTGSLYKNVILVSNIDHSKYDILY